MLVAVADAVSLCCMLYIMVDKLTGNVIPLIERGQGILEAPLQLIVPGDSNGTVILTADSTRTYTLYFSYSSTTERKGTRLSYSCTPRSCTQANNPENEAQWLQIGGEPNDVFFWFFLVEPF